MANIHTLVFNDFQVNTFIVADKSGDCVIVDPGCYYDSERKTLSEYITSNHLNVDRVINTHCHIDHILGNSFCCDYFQTGYYAHKAGMFFIEHGVAHGANYGFELDVPPAPTGFIDEDEIILVGEMELKVLYIPGHADCSICLVNEKEEYVITGDVLFNGGIGRTDLPTGDYDMLINGIRKKLFTLPDNFAVYPGHGPASTIGNEKRSNPFF
ncbi:MAG: MBL fold metallo-hydrolase [Bacteroidetes bacterium]|nr:MBL fold metallo-hydrolase [Bacteroidota bacterium]